MNGVSIFTWWAQLLRRRWLIGVAMFVIPFALGLTILVRAVPVYRAEARVRLGDPPPMGGVSPNASVLGLLRMGGDPFANDLELFASRTVAEGIVDDLALHVRLKAPRGWHRDSLFSALTADRNTRKARYEIEWTSTDVIVRTDSADVARVTAGTSASFGGVTLTPRPWRDGMPRRVTLSTIPYGEAVRGTQQKLKYDRARRDANVVVVHYQGTDPPVTRGVVERALERFIALRTTLVQRESSITVDSVRGVAARTRAELVEAERALESVQRTTGLIAPEAQGELAVEKYADVSARLELARLELRTLTAARERASSEDAAAAWAALLAYPRFLANDAMAEMAARLNELENRRRELSRRRAADNLELVDVQERMEYMDRTMRGLAADYATSLREEVATLERQDADMRREFAGLPAQVLELVRRQRDVRVLGEIVILAEQRLRQEELRQALTFANVQVIDPPALRYRPVWPRTKVGTVVTLLLAACSALTGMVLVDRADNRIRSERALREAIGVPVLATLDGTSVLDADSLHAILRHGVAEPDGIIRFALSDTGDGSLSQFCADVITRAAMLPGTVVPTPVIDLVPAVRNYAAASAAAAARVPLLLVFECGRSDIHAAARAAGLIREANGRIEGALVVCGDAHSAKAFWT